MTDTQASSSPCQSSLIDWGHRPEGDLLLNSSYEPASADLDVQLFSSPDIPLDFPSLEQNCTNEVLSSGSLQMPLFPDGDPLSNSSSEPPSLDLDAQLFSSLDIPLHFPSLEQNFTDEVLSSGSLQIPLLPTIEQDFLLKQHSSSAELQFSAQYSTGETISPDELQLDTAYTQSGNFLTEALNMPLWLNFLSSGIQEAQSTTNTIEEPLLPLIPINEQQHSEQQQSSRKDVPVLAASAKAGSTVLPNKVLGEDMEGPFPGIFCFQLNSDYPTILQKPRYSEKRRKELKEIRSIGACLRCKRLKKPCSKGTPCERCLQVWQSKRRSISLLPWMDCLRTSLVEVSTFRCRFSKSNDFLRFKNSYMEFANSNVQLMFSVPFNYNIEDISDSMLKWLLSTDSAHQFSMIGVMSSMQFASVITSHLGPQLATHFKALIYNASTLRNLSHVQATHCLVQRLPWVEYSGFQLLKQLEQLISPRRLGGFSVKARLSLFLVLIGTIISTKYYQQFIEDRPDVCHCKDRQGIGLKSKELINILGHYAVLVGERCIMKSGDSSECSLVTGSYHLWDKTEKYSWVPLQGHRHPEETSPCDHQNHTQPTSSTEASSTLPDARSDKTQPRSSGNAEDGICGEHGTLLETGSKSCRCGTVYIVRRVRRLL